MKAKIKPYSLSTSKMAAYLGFERSFLSKNKGILFFEGIHYTIPRGMKYPRWNVEAMEKWLKGQEETPISPTAQKALDAIIH